MGSCRFSWAPHWRWSHLHQACVALPATLACSHQCTDCLLPCPFHALALHRLPRCQKTAAGILLPKGPPKSNSDAHFGEVRFVHLLLQQTSPKRSYPIGGPRLSGEV
jgi:hypothetical protein